MRRLLFDLTAPSFILLLMAGCADPTSANWEGFVTAFLDSSYAANPAFAVALGKHEFDGRLPDFSDAGLKREITRLHRARDQALAFDSARLDSARRFERNYLITVLDGQLFWLERAEWPWKSPQYYSDALDPNAYIARDYAPLPERLKAMTGWARAIPDAVAQARANLRTPMPATYADIGRTGFGGLASFLEKDVPAVFASVKDSALQSAFRDASRDAIKALKDMDTWLAAERKRATNDFAMGPNLFREMLRATEAVDLSLEELEAIAQQDLQRNLDTLKEVCSHYAPGTNRGRLCGTGAGPQARGRCGRRGGAAAPDVGILHPRSPDRLDSRLRPGSRQGITTVHAVELRIP